MDWKRLLLFGGLTSGHFALTQLVSTAILRITPAAAQSELPPAALGGLVSIAKVLHFPIISLTWYPRPLFPGNWILLPMIANSLLWGAVLFIAWRLVGAALRKRSDRQ